MNPDDQELLLNPQESRDLEIKSWIDPTAPEGIAKIVRACIALFNNNGGQLLIGFDDNGQPSPDPPGDVRATYHVDVVQQAVAKYASQAISIQVRYGERDGVEYPIVSVPSGVETPVAAKRDLENPDKAKPNLIVCDAVYVRTLNSNHRVSSSPARWNDWPDIVRKCFTNREADIGGFLRRHLAGVDLTKVGFSFPAIKESKSSIEVATDILYDCESRFQAALSRQGIGVPADLGFREAAVVIDGEGPKYDADEQFLFELQANKPRHSGWTPWINTLQSSDPSRRPYISDDGWQSLIVELGQQAFSGTHIDFWRMEGSGRFFHLRALEDDMPQPTGRIPARGTQLDFVLQIDRVTEIMSAGLSFATTMGYPENTTNVVFAFRWRALKGRHLSCWVEPRGIYAGPAVDNSITTQVVVPLEVALDALASFVESAVKPLFRLFSGTVISTPVIEKIVKETLERQF